MEKIIQIISCETNNKFVKVLDNNYLDVPDVIVYVMTDKGYVYGYGATFEVGLPSIGRDIEVNGIEDPLLKVVDSSDLEAYFTSLKENYNEKMAIKIIKDFAERTKKNLPYCHFTKEAENWLNNY